MTDDKIQKLAEAYVLANMETKELSISEINNLEDIFIAGYTAAKDKPVQERFLMPSDKQLVEFAIIVNEGKLEQEKLADMVAMCELILDRLHEHGNVMQKSSKEKMIEHED